MISVELQNAWQFVLLCASLCLLSAALGALIMRSRARREHEKLESISQQLSMQLQLEKERYLEKIETIEESRKQLRELFLSAFTTST